MVEKVSERTASDANPQVAELGRLLGKERGDLTLALVLLVVGLPAFVLALPGVFLQNPVALVVCLAGLVATFAGALLFFTNCANVTAFHEHGIRKGPPRGQRVYYYHDATELSYTMDRWEHNGVPLGRCHLLLRFGSAEGKRLRLTLTYKNRPGLTTSRDVEHILSVIADHIAARMEEQRARGESVSWTDRMRLNVQGIELRGAKEDWEPIRWPRVSRLEADGDTFRIWVDGETQPKMQATTAEPNALAGFRFVEAKWRERVDALQRRQAAATASLPANLAGGLTAEAITVRFTLDLEDQLAAVSYSFWNKAFGKGWLIRGFLAHKLNLLRIAFPLLALAVIGSTSSLGVWRWVLLGGCLGAVALVVGWPYLLWVFTKRRVRLGWQTAVRLSQKGQGANPAFPMEITVAARGCQTNNLEGELLYLWGQFTTIDWYAGQIFLLLPGTAESPLRFILIPERAFATKEEARKTYETIKEWRRIAV